ncbi:hypothetical protein GCM10009557_16660 [Virgisporangium ochraceum]|uniref:Uncharacterized protein n=1 Tax=Virgisporangium ochraceum TaxID=65505 RepID=A0A8J3ZRD4_9ACTN|nr:hypothetical protein [Virgisporangium ochraceum]GIJ68519.1 hypothetical protein Voc01_034360 [Virgisporangium ochraceum]
MDIRLWFDAARRFLLPELPGQWRVKVPYLIHEPVGWTARVVTPTPSDHRPGFYLEAMCQLLAVPRRDLVADNGLRVGHATVGGYWDAAPAVDAYEPVMRQLADLIRDDALPHFDRYGSVDGYLAFLRERMATLAGRGGEWIDINVDEALAYTQLIRGDLAGAREAAGYADRAMDSDGRIAWVRDAHARVTTVMAAADRDPAAALDLLRDNARRTAKALRLPAPEL